MKRTTVFVYKLFLCLLAVALPTSGFAQSSTVIDQDNRSDFIFARELNSGKEWLCMQIDERLKPGFSVATSNSEYRIFRPFQKALRRAKRQGNSRKVRKIRQKMQRVRKLCNEQVRNGFARSDDTKWWLDTGENNGLEEESGLFEFQNYSGQNYLETFSDLINIHSHYLGFKAESGESYLYQGQMKMGDEEEQAGIGVTFLSDYPNEDHYYRLRAYSSGSFHIAPHGTSVTYGDLDTEVELQSFLWYSFQILVTSESGRTRIRAKVWSEVDEEPADWQVDCYDDSEDRRSNGLFGVWAMREGWKNWRNLKVQALD